jgi:hypothetical protein
MYVVVVISKTKFTGEKFTEAVELSQPNSGVVIFANIAKEMELDESMEFARSFIHDRFCVMIYDSSSFRSLKNTAEVYEKWSWTLLK